MAEPPSISLLPPASKGSRLGGVGVLGLFIALQALASFDSTRFGRTGSSEITGYRLQVVIDSKEISGSPTSIGSSARSLNSFIRVALSLRGRR